MSIFVVVPSTFGSASIQLVVMVSAVPLRAQSYVKVGGGLVPPVPYGVSATGGSKFTNLDRITVLHEHPRLSSLFALKYTDVSTVIPRLANAVRAISTDIIC